MVQSLISYVWVVLIQNVNLTDNFSRSSMSRYRSWFCDCITMRLEIERTIELIYCNANLRL